MADIGDECPGQGTFELAFPVLGQPTTSSRPCKSPLNHPSLGKQGEAFGPMRSFDYFQYPFFAECLSQFLDCELFFEEKTLGARKRRPALEAMLEQIRADDIVVVTSLDRLAKSTLELLGIAEASIEKNSGIQSLDEPWADTTSPSGKMVMTVFGGIAEFGRSLILAPQVRQLIV